MGQGGGREGELLKKLTEKLNVGSKLAVFLMLQEFFKKISGKY